MIRQLLQKRFNYLHLFAAALLVPPIYEWPSISNALMAIGADPAVEILDARMITPTAELGRPLYIEFQIRQRQACEGTIDRIWIKDKENLVVYRLRAPYMGVAATGQVIRRQVRYDQPDGLVPGAYTVHTTPGVHCDDGRDYKLPSTLHFEIVPRSDR